MGIALSRLPVTFLCPPLNTEQVGTKVSIIAVQIIEHKDTRIVQNYINEILMLSAYI